MISHDTSGHLATYAENQKKRGRKTVARTVERVAQAFYPYRSEVTTILSASLITALLGLVSPILIAAIIDNVIPKGNNRLLIVYVTMMGAAPILSGIIGVGQTYLNNQIGQNVMRDFRNRLYRHLQGMPLHFFKRVRTDELQSRLVNDIGGVQGVVTNTVTNLVSNSLVVLSTIIAMALFSPLLTLITLALLPLFLWITYKVGNARQKTSKETQKSLTSLTALMQETFSVSEILLVKIFGRQKYAEAQLQQKNKKLTDQSVRQLMIGRWLFMIMGTLLLIIPTVIYLVGSEQIIYHASVLGSNMTLGTMIAFVLLQTRLFFPAGQLLSMRDNMEGALTLFDRIFEYLDIPTGMTDKPDALQFKPEQVRGELTFRDVTFSYKSDTYKTLTGFNEEEKQDKSKTKRPVLPKWNATPPAQPKEPHPVLKNISFTIKPGQLAVLVGPSGSGKTMITNMVPRLYDVDSGAIEIDGTNVKDIAQASLGELIGVVTPEAYLSHASIRENILYARPDATEEEMIAAAQAAAIHKRILELKDGYDTIVGERGQKLSSGEKQRIAIARIMLKNPRILILDETTNGLDADSKHLIEAALDTLIKGRTTLVIARRSSTILAADLVLVVNKGEIVERGTHQELLALGGLYTRRYYEQSLRQLEAKARESNTASIQETAMMKELDPPIETQTPATQQRVVQPRLLISAPHLDEVHEVPLEKDTIRLGEADSNDIIFDKDSMASPYHALLRKKEGDYYLFDQYSNRRVFVNGQKLALGVGHKLVDGDQIIIGYYNLIFSTTPDQNQTKPMMRISIPKRIALKKNATDLHH